MDVSNKLRTDIKNKYGPMLLKLVTEDVKHFANSRPEIPPEDEQKLLVNICWMAIGDYALEQLEKGL